MSLVIFLYTEHTGTVVQLNSVRDEYGAYHTQVPGIQKGIIDSMLIGADLK